MLAHERADLVFHDYMMPVMDGGEMLLAMAADPMLRAIPVETASLSRAGASWMEYKCNSQTGSEFT